MPPKVEQEPAVAPACFLAAWQRPKSAAPRALPSEPSQHQLALRHHSTGPASLASRHQRRFRPRPASAPKHQGVAPWAGLASLQGPQAYRLGMLVQLPAPLPQRSWRLPHQVPEPLMRCLLPAPLSLYRYSYWLQRRKLVPRPELLPASGHRVAGFPLAWRPRPSAIHYLPRRRFPGPRETGSEIPHQPPQRGAP